MMHGYAGSLLDINLTDMVISEMKLTDELMHSLGGIGITTSLVASNVPGDVDAFSPDNVLCFAVGALVGTDVPTASRTEASAKSPATGLFGTSNSGGFWGSELKFAGFDGIIIRGKAKYPVFIAVFNSDVKILSAELMIGKDAWETIKTIRQTFSDPEIQVAAIGQAGENLCRFASIQNGPYDAWGRTGLGAVMGSKNLKAIAVRGTKGVKVFNKNSLRAEIEQCRSAIYQSPFYAPFSKFGTMLATIPYYEFGALPGRNFQSGRPNKWLETRSRKQVEKYSKRGISCIACPIACAHWVEIKEGPYSGLNIKDMEVTPVIGFGAGCDIDNIPAIAKLTEQCQRYGMDMVSAAGTIAFAMELFQRGILKESDLGFKLLWGDEDAVFSLLRLIATREGIGNLLAEGTMRAAKMINGADYYAMHIKGLEIPMADPRGRWSTWTFGNITNIRGGDHLRSRSPVENLRFNSDPINYQFEKFGFDQIILDNLDVLPDIKNRIIQDDNVNIPLMTKWSEDLITVYNSVGICIRPPVLQAIGPTRIAKLFSFLTGIDKTREEVVRAGERTWNLQRLFNLTCGEIKSQSDFPERFYSETLPDSPYKQRKLERSNVQELLNSYYTARGWNQLGIPLESKLLELGLLDTAALNRTV